MRKDMLWVIVAGAIVGALAVILTKLGNSANMGFCIACFERDITGALGFFNWAAGPKYIRPEIIGIVIGGFLTAVAYKEFQPRSGSAPAVRFLLGALMMIGALVFLGCPLRMVIRLGGGDLNALVALAGFIAGVAAGVVLLRRGFNLGRTVKGRALDGWILPGFMVLLLLLVFFVPSFIEGGPILQMPSGYVGGEGSPVGLGLGIIISLAAGLLVGYLAQRSRLCFAGGFRDLMLSGSMHLAVGIIAVLAVVLIGNLVLGNFGGETGLHWGFANQPVANDAHIWNFLGMALVGLCAVLLGGCPLRQLILAGNGNTDSTMAIFGMMAGAAVAHNLNLVKAATIWGQAVVIIGIIVVIIIGMTNRSK